VRNGLVAAAVAALVLIGYGIGRANDEDQTVVTVKVTSAEHEMMEGYFSLGENTTVMVKPGSELFRFLSRHRNRTVTITLSERPARQLSRLDR
jgi:hypothetical protein